MDGGYTKTSVFRSTSISIVTLNGTAVQDGRNNLSSTGLLSPKEMLEPETTWGSVVIGAI